MRTTMTSLPETDFKPLRWGWLDRLAGHLCAAYAGEGEGEGEGDDGGDEGGDPAVDDDETAFGGDDDDDQGEGSDDGGDDGEGEDDGEEEDSSLFDEDEDDDDGADDGAGEGDEEEGEEATLTDEEQAEEQEAHERFEELTNGRMERAAREETGGIPALNVKLGEVQIRSEARARFKKVLEKDGDDAEIQAEAIFEVAMDAAMQTMEQYHSQDVAPRLTTRLEANQAATLNSRYEAFVKTPEGAKMNADKTVRDEMQRRWEADKQKHGVSAAMKLSYKDYFRLSGGKVTKAERAAHTKGTAAPKKAAKKAKSKASKRKARDLAASRTPRAKQSGSLARNKRRKGKSTEQESAEYNRATSEPFFQVT